MADLHHHQTSMHLDKQKQQQQLSEDGGSCGGGVGGLSAAAAAAAAAACYNHNNNQGFLQHLQPHHIKPDKDGLEAGGGGGGGYPVKPEEDAENNGRLVGSGDNSPQPPSSDNYRNTSNPDGKGSTSMNSCISGQSIFSYQVKHKSRGVVAIFIEVLEFFDIPNSTTKTFNLKKLKTN